MLLATRDAGTAADKVERARRIVGVLEEVASAGGSLAAAVGEFRTRDVEAGASDAYLLHDELEAYNAPCYVVDFLDRARAHGLAFLGEARPTVMYPPNYGEAVARFVTEEAGGSQILIEQYLDVLTQRTFRETLLVHAERDIDIRHAIDHERYGRLHFAASVAPVDGETHLDNSAQAYAARGSETVLQVDNPGIKAAFDAMRERWPWTSSRAELVAEVTARLAHVGIFAGRPAVEQVVDHVLDVLVWQVGGRWRCTPVSGAPASDPLHLPTPVRRMAELTRSLPTPYTFTEWHELVGMSAIDAWLLPLLDGTRDGDALVEELVVVHRRGALTIALDGAPVRDEDDLRLVLRQYVDALPQRLRELSLARPA